MYIIFKSPWKCCWSDLMLTHLHCISDRGFNGLTQEQLDCENKATINMSSRTHCFVCFVASKSFILHITYLWFSQALIRDALINGSAIKSEIFNIGKANKWKCFDWNLTAEKLLNTVPASTVNHYITLQIEVVDLAKIYGICNFINHSNVVCVCINFLYIYIIYLLRLRHSSLEVHNRHQLMLSRNKHSCCPNQR